MRRKIFVKGAAGFIGFHLAHVRHRDRGRAWRKSGPKPDAVAIGRCVGDVGLLNGSRAIGHARALTRVRSASFNGITTSTVSSSVI